MRHGDRGLRAPRGRVLERRGNNRRSRRGELVRPASEIRDCDARAALQIRYACGCSRALRPVDLDIDPVISLGGIRAARSRYGGRSRPTTTG